MPALRSLQIYGWFLLLLFQPPAWNSCRRSLSAATVCCCWPLSSSTGAIWGLSGFLEGTTVLFVKGVERAAHSLSTLIHLQDYLPSNLTKKSSSKRVIPYHFCGYDTSSPTRKAYVCASMCMCFTASFVLAFVSYSLPCMSHFIPRFNGSGWQPHLKLRDERHHLQVGICSPSVRHLHAHAHTHTQTAHVTGRCSSNARKPEWRCVFILLHVKSTQTLVFSTNFTWIKLMYWS